MNTKYVLEKIKIEGDLFDIIAKSDGENITVDYNGTKTLAAALAEILASTGEAQTASEVQAAIKTAIDDLIDGAPDTYDTLKEIADYIKKDETAASALTQQLAGKLDKTVFETFKGEIETLGAMAGKDKVSEADLDEGLTAKIGSSHTHSNKSVLDGITAGQVEGWNNKADKTEATQSAPGLMSAADKKRLDAIRGVRYGTEPPEDMQNGELFIRVVTDTP